MPSTDLWFDIGHDAADLRSACWRNVYDEITDIQGDGPATSTRKGRVTADARRLFDDPIGTRARITPGASTVTPMARTTRTWPAARSVTAG